MLMCRLAGRWIIVGTYGPGGERNREKGRFLEIIKGVLLELHRGREKNIVMGNLNLKGGDNTRDGITGLTTTGKEMAHSGNILIICRDISDK